MLMQSISLIGVSYHQGGNIPEQGFDNAGFIYYLFKKSFNIDLPRTSAEMSKLGKKFT